MENDYENVFFDQSCTPKPMSREPIDKQLDQLCHYHCKVSEEVSTLKITECYCVSYLWLIEK